MLVTPIEIRKWLDRQVDAYHTSLERLEVNDDGDYLSNIGVQDRGIHLGSDAVRFIADRLNIGLCVTSRKGDTENPYEIFILYKGEKFFGIETEAEYQEKGAVV